MLEQGAWDAAGHLNKYNPALCSNLSQFDHGFRLHGLGKSSLTKTALWYMILFLREFQIIVYIYQAPGLHKKKKKDLSMLTSFHN